MTVRLNGKVVSQLPSYNLVLGGGAPVYARETTRPDYLDKLARPNESAYSLDRDWNDTLLKLLSSPNLCHKGWVFEQYDHSVRTNTAVGPGSDAAVLRLRKTDKALAMTTDCNARYCYLDPGMGARIAVAEAARNIVCSGGKPLAVTNCLNFGNPYKPEIYYCFAEAVKGMGEACRAFNTPVTGGNVSFYNEDPERAVFPTPTIGMIGLIEHVDHITTQWFEREGDRIILVGTNQPSLGASEYLRTIHGETRGPVPAIDLETEKNLQDVLLMCIQKGTVASAHDVSDGGLAIALAECCISNPALMLGAEVNLADDIRPDALLFGEAQSRAILSVRPDQVDAVIDRFTTGGCTARDIGTVKGDRLTIGSLVSVELERLASAFYGAMSTFMEQVT
jgi:phosphoribosylformylglycinamidine synthase